MGDTVKAKVKVSAIIEIDDEIRKGAKEQYGITDDQEIADMMLKILVKEAILDKNVKDCYWDGVVKMNRNIKRYDVEKITDIFTM